MQNLNDGIGDLKKLTFARSDRDAAERTAVPRTRRRKIIWLMVAVLLTWGALHIALSEILSTQSLHR
ncbi:hypothetical protein KY49_7041 [Burkholderia sp. MSHR3999]|nr:hypothetical protein KY49_7041 [Burkholderia sp. MSHR3999]